MSPESPDPARSSRLDRTGFRTVFDASFSGPSLDADQWLDQYLPHWTTRPRAAARYRLAGGCVELRIESDQPAWLPEDGEMRVSSLQTGTSSGPLGSERGPMPHRGGLVVRTPQPSWRSYAPSEGLVEATLRAEDDPTTMLAFWLVGFGDPAEDSGEICVAEIFGSAVGAAETRVNIGVKKHRDPRLEDDMETVSVPIDAREPHRYSAMWDPSGVRFFIDDELIRVVPQVVDYPLIVLVDLFEFPSGAQRDPRDYPKRGWVHEVRGSQRE